MSTRRAAVLTGMALILSRQIGAAAIIVWSDRAQTQDGLSALYIQAFDSLVDWDQAKSAGLQYVAIDTTKLEGLDGDGVQRVLEFFRNKYRVEALAASVEDLRSQGGATTVGLVHSILFRGTNTIPPSRKQARNLRCRRGVNTSVMRTMASGTGRRHRLEIRLR